MQYIDSLLGNRDELTIVYRKFFASSDLQNTLPARPLRDLCTRLSYYEVADTKLSWRFADVLTEINSHYPTGDFAVLLQAGMSIQKAIVYNIVSSVLSFVGMAAGVWIGEYEVASMWIYAFTAGAFLYISLVDLVSIHIEMLQVLHSKIFHFSTLSTKITTNTILFHLACYRSQKWKMPPKILEAF